MDPDGLSTTLICISVVCACFAAFRAGTVSANEPERQQDGILGFSDRMAGICCVFVFVCGFFVYGCLRMFAAAPAWTILCLALLLPVCILLFSFGRAKGHLKNKDAFTAASVFGIPFCFPAKLVLRSAGISAQADVTAEDVLSLVDDVEEHELIDESQREMINNIFELDDLTAGDVMTHRTEIISLQQDTPAAQAIRISLANGFSRLPVYCKSLDDIVGILYVKDLFALWDSPELADEPVKRFMRTAMFVPEACRARELLIDFKRKHTQIAVVVDEYGGTSGLATMEDVLEEIVGNIQDEFDNEEEVLVSTDDGFIADGSAELEDIFDAFSLDMPDEDEDGEADFDTVGGLITDRIGRIPAQDEDISISYGGLLFTVLAVEDRRVGKVKCVRLPDADGIGREEEDK